MQSITPFLWFDDQAQQAAEFYVSVFPGSRILEDSPMMTRIQLGGSEYVFFNGGPQFALNEAFSLTVGCETQVEIDELWETLTAGGEESQCGWLRDKFGVSWQVTPTVLSRLLGDPDPKKSQRALQAMLGMKKLVIQDLQDAFDGVA